MAHNPYTPPQAPVSNLDPRRRGEPPKQVLWAVWLMRISLVAGYASLLFVQDLTIEMKDVPPEGRTASIAFFLFVLAMTAVVSLWLIQNVKNGRNWARMVMLVLTVLGIGSSLLGGDEAPPLMRAVSFVDMMIDVTAMVLLFKAPGSAWFASRT